MAVNQECNRRTLEVAAEPSWLAALLAQTACQGDRDGRPQPPDGSGNDAVIVNGRTADAGPPAGGAEVHGKAGNRRLTGAVSLNYGPTQPSSIQWAMVGLPFSGSASR
jgi:hypothetical protein